MRSIFYSSFSILPIYPMPPPHPPSYNFFNKLLLSISTKINHCQILFFKNWFIFSDVIDDLQLRIALSRDVTRRHISSDVIEHHLSPWRHWENLSASLPKRLFAPATFARRSPQSTPKFSSVPSGREPQVEEFMGLDGF